MIILQADCDVWFLIAFPAWVCPLFDVFLCGSTGFGGLTRCDAHVFRMSFDDWFGAERKYKVHRSGSKVAPEHVGEKFPSLILLSFVLKNKIEEQSRQFS